MATAYASAAGNEPIETVWKVIRDFNVLPDWNPAITRNETENGQAADQVGAIPA